MSRRFGKPSPRELATIAPSLSRVVARFADHHHRQWFRSRLRARTEDGDRARVFRERVERGVRLLCWWALAQSHKRQRIRVA